MKNYDLAVKSNENFIRIYENVLSKDFCENLINKFENLRDLGELNSIDRQGKSTNDTYLEKHVKFDEELFIIVGAQNKAYKKYLDEFPILQNSPSHKARFWKLRRIEIGDHYSNREWHYEQETAYVKDQGCIVSSMFYLNDVEEGGETELPYQGIKVKPEAGKLMFFPSCYTHTHRAIPPISNLKYIIVSFLYFVIEKHDYRIPDGKERE